MEAINLSKCALKNYSTGYPPLGHFDIQKNSNEYQQDNFDNLLDLRLFWMRYPMDNFLMSVYYRVL